MTQRGRAALQEKLGISEERAAGKAVDLAWRRGLQSKNAGGKFKLFLKAMESQGTVVRVYEGNIYFFRGHDFLTISALPSEYLERAEHYTSLLMKSRRAFTENFGREWKKGS